jgi:hypothetical protein
VDGVPQKEQKSWGAQIVPIVVLAFLFCSPLIARFVHIRMSVAEIGAAYAIGTLLLIGIAVRAVRTWDW